MSNRKAASRTQQSVEHARGSIEKPLSDAELEAKVYALASQHLPKTNIEQCLAMLWQLQNMATMHPLMALVAGDDDVESN